MRFLCPSGHRLKAASWMIGAEVRCPRCGQATVVPRRTAAGTRERPPAPRDRRESSESIHASELEAASAVSSSTSDAGDPGTVVLSVDDLIDRSVVEDSESSAQQAPEQKAAAPKGTASTDVPPKSRAESAGKNGSTPPPLPKGPPPLPARERESASGTEASEPTSEDAASLETDEVPADAEPVGTPDEPHHVERPRKLWRWGALWDLEQIDPEALPRHDAGAVRNARLVAGLVAAIVLATSLPIWWAGEWAPWMFALGALVWIELAVVMMGVVFPDWSMMLRQLYVFGIAAAGLGALAAFVQFAPVERALPLGLDAYRASAGRVAATLMLLQLLAAVVCGWYAGGWKRRDMLRLRKTRLRKRR
ncbi:MAG: hypothetical protein D6741_02080 [Planctomycetota bacterium]|nr:MAG: hypothetical protein D6741_02080 [Planctomycetota bacterium]